jgi:tRNA A-37 threonylcarbamoyl transferase component Bud32
MSDSDKAPSELLASFCEDDYDDKWEEQQLTTQSLERYTDKTFLAAGGLKNIFKVYDSKLNRDIALAELKEHLPEEQCETFLEEINLTASLRHPNIITVYDFGVNDQQLPYFTMELKVGDSLADIIKKQQRTLKERLEIFIKVCDAVAYAHSKKIIHLDLKPENIQVGEFGEVQLCDWGLSQEITGSLINQKIKGTPGYMAPEQLEKGAPLDARTDVFALGAILSSLVTEERPIAGGVNTVIASTTSDKIPSPSERFPNKDIPMSLDSVIQKTMAIPPNERYQKVDDLRCEINQYLTGHSTSAEEAGFITELSLFINRNRQICFISFIAAALIMTSALFFFIEIQKSKTSTEIALADLEKAHLHLQESQAKERMLFKQKKDAQKKSLKAVKERQRIYAQLLNKELKHANDLMLAPLFFSSPKKSTAKAHKILLSQYDEKKEHIGLKNLLIINLFISQRFAEIQKYQDHEYAELTKIATKYKDLPRTKYGILTDKDFIRLLQEINALPSEKQELKRKVFERLICYMVDTRQPIFTSTQIVQELLLCWNPAWDSTQMKYNHNTLTLKLSGKNLTKLLSSASHSSDRCFLRFLKIETLDLRHSGIDQLSNIAGLNVRKLDIRHTKIKHLHPHGATKNIQEVYLSPRQFKGKEALFLPKSVKLIYQKDKN